MCLVEYEDACNYFEVCINIFTPLFLFCFFFAWVSDITRCYLKVSVLFCLRFVQNDYKDASRAERMLHSDRAEDRQSIRTNDEHLSSDSEGIFLSFKPHPNTSQELPDGNLLPSSVVLVVVHCKVIVPGAHRRICIYCSN